MLDLDLIQVKILYLSEKSNSHPYNPIKSLPSVPKISLEKAEPSHDYLPHIELLNFLCVEKIPLHVYEEKVHQYLPREYASAV